MRNPGRISFSRDYFRKLCSLWKNAFSSRAYSSRVHTCLHFPGILPNVSAYPGFFHREMRHIDCIFPPDGLLCTPQDRRYILCGKNSRSSAFPPGELQYPASRFCTKAGQDLAALLRCGRDIWGIPGNFFFHNTPKNGECPAVRRGIGFIINQRR